MVKIAFHLHIKSGLYFIDETMKTGLWENFDNLAICQDEIEEIFGIFGTSKITLRVSSKRPHSKNWKKFTVCWPEFNWCRLKFQGRFIPTSYEVRLALVKLNLVTKGKESSLFVQVVSD